MADNGIHFPKGEGIKIIKQASEAKVPDTIYIRAIDQNYAEIIILSKSGKIRKVGFSAPENSATIDIFDADGNIVTEGNVYLKEQITALLESSDFDSKFDEDFVITLKNNGYWGRFLNGQTVPAKGKTAKEVILDACIDLIPPVYISPTASITGTTNTNIETGTTLSITVTGTFTQNDAGQKTAERILKNSTQASTTNSFTESIKLSLPVTYRYEVDYAQGAIKNDSAGNPYPNGRIPAGTQTANRIYTPSLKRFFGAGVSGLTNYRSLSSDFDTSALTWIIDSGNSLKDFYILIPANRTLQSVVDLDALNANITSSFIMSNVQVPDAGGDLQNYKLYKMSNAAPYAASHRLQITIS